MLDIAFDDFISSSSLIYIRLGRLKYILLVWNILSINWISFFLFGCVLDPCAVAMSFMDTNFDVSVGSDVSVHFLFCIVTASPFYVKTYWI
jgi:hypothetical protein